jgi:hypothetical protein
MNTTTTAGQLLTGAFVNDNQPPHHYIVRDLSGNYEAGYVTLSYKQQPPAALRQGELYYVGSNEKNFPDSRYLGWDKNYLRFKYPA